MEIVISLLMFLGEPAVLKEHTLMPNLSTCLSKKRIATRNSGSRVIWQCAKVKAEVIDGKIVGMLQQELLNIDKQMGRIYAHIDRLMSK